MAKFKYWGYITDDEGNVLPDTEISVYTYPIETEAYVFTSESSTTPTNEDPQTTTLADGYFEFYIADENEADPGVGEDEYRYNWTQRFKLVWTKKVNNIPVNSGFINNINIFPLSNIEEIDIESELKTNSARNKAISNLLGYKWDSHVEFDIRTAGLDTTSAHGLEPVDLTSNNAMVNKVVSNALIRELYYGIVKGSTNLYDTVITPEMWIADGDIYYYDVTHNRNDNYVKVKVFDDNNISVLTEYEVLGPNSIRLTTVDNTVTYIIRIVSIADPGYFKILAGSDWYTSGGSYIADVTHELDVWYPDVKVFDTNNVCLLVEYQIIDEDNIRLIFDTLEPPYKVYITNE